MPVLFATISAVSTATLIWLLLQTGLAWKILDRPNARSMHSTPIPRVGGICLISAALVAAMIGPSRSLFPVTAIAAALAAVSLGDDVFGLPVWLRLGVHLAAAALALSIYPEGSWLLWLLLLPGFVWFINLFNFMDGLDGLAGGMAVAGFGAYSIAALIHNQPSLGFFAACLAGANAGFLVFNAPPARVFMGDAGSIAQGFLAAALGYVGVRQQAWGWWFPLLAFSPFIADATVTLATRLIMGEIVWQAHRKHFYQRMAQSELGQFGTVWRWYVLMGASALSAILLLQAKTAVLAASLAAWVAFYAVVMTGLNRKRVKS